MKLEIPIERLLEIIDRLGKEERLLIKKRLEQLEKKQHRIIELEGLGSEIWKEIDIEGYIHKERDGWT